MHRRLKPILLLAGGGEVNITEPKNYDPNATYKKGDVVKYQGWGV